MTHTTTRRPIVLIAGKNGSGKSRLLKIIKEHYEEKPLESQIYHEKNK